MFSVIAVMFSVMDALRSFLGNCQDKGQVTGEVRLLLVKDNCKENIPVTQGICDQAKC